MDANVNETGAGEPDSRAPTGRPLSVRPGELDLKDFLSSALFYPASGADVTPIAECPLSLGNFVYADYSLAWNLAQSLLLKQCPGYRVQKCVALAADEVLNGDWADLERRHARSLHAIPFDWEHPHVVLATFKRARQDPATAAWPECLRILFLRFEGVAAYAELYTSRGIAPACLTHLKGGMGLGGNYPEFPAWLCETMDRNPAGLPPHLLHDASCRPGEPDYLPILDRYEVARTWTRTSEKHPALNLCLRRLKTATAS